KMDVTDEELEAHHYEIALEAVQQILAEHSDGITINRLVNKAIELLGVGSPFSDKQIKGYIRRIIFDLKNAGIVEDVPNIKPRQIRPLIKGREALMDATRRGHAVIVARLLTEEVEPDTMNSALISAVINNRVEIVRLLIKAGADVNARERLFDRTPLMYIT